MSTPCPPHLNLGRLPAEEQKDYRVLTSMVRNDHLPGATACQTGGRPVQLRPVVGRER